MTPIPGKKVFVVKGGWDYEGSHVHAITETQLEAETIRKELESIRIGCPKYYDYIEIEERIIGEVYHPYN